MGYFPKGSYGYLTPPVIFRPATPTSYSTASATSAAMDSTNLSISGTFGPSGRALAKLSAPVELSVASQTGWWCLLDHASGNLVGDQALVVSGLPASDATGITVSIIVVGAPGARFHWDWAQGVSGGATFTTFAGRNDTTTVDNTADSPAIMEVFAA